VDSGDKGNETILTFMVIQSSINYQRVIKVVDFSERSCPNNFGSD